LDFLTSVLYSHAKLEIKFDHLSKTEKEKNRETIYTGHTRSRKQYAEQVIGKHEALKVGRPIHVVWIHRMLILNAEEHGIFGTEIILIGT